jgi:hypothetical protein
MKAIKLSEKYMYVFFDTECTQDLEKREGSLEHVRNLICIQQMCSKCVTMDDTNVDGEQCGLRTHVFWQDPVGKFIDYLHTSRSFADKIYVISHNPRGSTHSFFSKDFWNSDGNRN